MAEKRPARSPKGGGAARPPAVELEAGGSRGRSLFGASAIVRFARGQPLGFAGGLVVLGLAVAALTATALAPYGPNELAAGERLDAPSLHHWMGTDNLGRDVFSRVLYGARVSMWIGLLSVATSAAVGVAVGVVSGYLGGAFDILVQRVVDAFIAFPGLVFILAVVAVFRGHRFRALPAEGLLSTPVLVLIVALGILLGFGWSRVIRGATLAVKGTQYIEAARATGAGHWRIILVHVLPNVMAPVITLATLGLGTAILLEASLSFIGLGVPPDVPTWGGMLNREARGFMTEAPWLALAPGLALSMAIFGCNMLGDALRDLLDPRLRGSGGTFR